MGQQATPAADHLFKVNEDGRKLGEDQSDAFHHTVYQLLFAANRARRDIQTAVSFLTTRVKAPDEDDWGKLKRVLRYLNGTKHLKLTLQADQLKFAVHWYVDGSHQIHEDCRGQTLSLVTFGKGAVYSSSTKMKQNTKSSTETELISLGDKLTDIVWMRYFIECQGFDLDEYIVFQDNMSALSLEKNGRISSSKRTKHIKAKYFLIKDYYNAGEIDVKFCPTEQMWADVLTKPLQGAKFRLMRAFLMNCPIDYYDDPDLNPTAIPTSNPIKPSVTSPPRINSSLPFVPTDKPTDNPMKHRSLRSTPSSRGCVETKSHGTKVPSPSRAYEYAPKTNSPSHAYEYAPKTKSGERTDGPVTELAEKPELAGHSEGGGEERAPLLYVRGQRWSPGVYRSMRLLGRSVEVAWERAFIALPTF